MKRFFLGGVLCALLPLVMVAQSSWNYLPNVPVQGGRIDDVFFINEKVGWFADNDGFIRHTKDGGISWEQQLFASGNQYFRCIEFRDSLLGFAGTLNKRLYRTDNGGLSWTNVATQIQPLPNAICGIDIADSTTVYAVGEWDSPAFFLKSTDKGLTWTRKNMSAWSNGLVEINFISRDTGYVSGTSSTGGVILYTTDGGENWTQVFSTGNPGEYVWKLQRVTPEVWVASVQTFNSTGRMVKSTDNGQSWFTLPAPLPDMQGIGFATPDHGWVGGYGQGFYETLDGGQSWDYQAFGGNFNRFYFLDSTLAYASGNSIYKFTPDSMPSSTVTWTPDTPFVFELSPNPATDRLWLEFTLAELDILRVTVLSPMGYELRSLFQDRLPAGRHRLELRLDELPAGNYILGIQRNHGLHARPFQVLR